MSALEHPTLAETLAALVQTWRADSLLLGESDGYGQQLDRCGDDIEAIIRSPEFAELVAGATELREARHEITCCDDVPLQDGPSLFMDDQTKRQMEGMATMRRLGA